MKCSSRQKLKTPNCALIAEARLTATSPLQAAEELEKIIVVGKRERVAQETLDEIGRMFDRDVTAKPVAGTLKPGAGVSSCPRTA